MMQYRSTFSIEILQMSPAMITRIVRMHFSSDTAEQFLRIFRENQNAIRASNGCTHLELLQDIDNPDIFFTISLWESPEALQAYRHSSLFRRTWNKTRALFAEKPAAWSTRVINNPDV